jgi:hypothetical protein
MTTGPYAGITIFQARSNTSTLFFGNGSSVKVDGTIYAPAAMVQFTQGNASSSLGSTNNLYPTVISKQLQVIDGANVIVNGTGGGKGSMSIVE